MRPFLLIFTAALLLVNAASAANHDAPMTVKDSAAYSAGVLTSAIVKQRADSTISNDIMADAFNDVYSDPKKAEVKLKEMQAYMTAAELAKSLYSQFDSTFNTAVIAAGIKDAWENKTSMKPEEAQEKLMAYLGSRVKKEADAYLAEVDKKASIQKSETGLRYIISERGEGQIDSTDTVLVNYTLYDMNGNQVDTNTNTEPMRAALPGGVVAGFAEGLQLLGKGGKATIYIPAELGYGDSPAQHQMGGKVLHFDIEVVDVLPDTEVIPQDESTDEGDENPISKMSKKEIKERKKLEALLAKYPEYNGEY